MKIQKLHGSGACSSLIIFSLGTVTLNGEPEDVYYETPKEFLGGLKDAIEEYDEDGESTYSQGKYHTWYVKDYAFFVVSTSHKQQNVEEILREIGFTPTERVKKNKNPDHEVTLWTAPVRNILKLL